MTVAAGSGLPVHCCAPLELLDELLEEELLVELLELDELLEEDEVLLDEELDEELLDELTSEFPGPPHAVKSAMHDTEAEFKIQ